MDRKSVRGAAFWTTVVTTLMGSMISLLYLFPQVTPNPNGSMNVLWILSTVNFFVHVLSGSSLMLFLGLVHYDLITAQRLSEHARDYLIRDLSQPTQENTPNHG